MKISIDYDEVYPVFFLTEEEGQGNEVDVPDEKARHFIILQNHYHAMQKELRQLYGYKEVWEESAS